MTTTLGIISNDGVILAADRRVSAGESFIASKQGEKIHKIDEFIGISIAGLVSDAQDLIDRLRAEFKLYKYERGYQISLSAAAQLTAKIFHSSFRQGMPLYTEIIIAGLDKEKNEPHLYVLDPSGALIPDKYFISTGSGSPVSYGVLEGNYKRDISREDAVKLAVRALNAAIERNPHTGNGIDVAIITKNGYELVSEEKINEILKGGS
ncbi:MAG: proteasome subunit beta [Candidatus Lokiarchaeota archaeon]|nr:proteasome subunit beta [Candidatus Lokiarchaeota archaeon]